MNGRRVDLERARREAKALVRAARDGDHVALARLRASGSFRLPGPGNDQLIAAARLADGQLTVARELGARSWPALVRLAKTAAHDAAPRPVGDLPPYGELGWTLQAAYLRLVAAVPGVEARPVGDGVAVRTGVPSNAQNGVVCTCLGDADVAEVVEWLGTVPAKWLVGPQPSAAGLGDRLAAAGAVPERRMVFMGAELAELDTAPSDMVDPVRTPADLQEWLEVAAACLGVAPGARGRGVGRTVTRAALHVAVDSGCRHALVEPEPDTLAFFGQLGFRVVAWPPNRTWYLPLASTGQRRHR